MEERVTEINGIPLNHIQSVLKIDPNSPSGLSWLPRDKKSNGQKDYKCGSVRIEPFGYKSYKLSITYNKKQFTISCSRIVFFLANGFFTKGKMIDHIDGDSLNNKLENLREATRSQNAQNSKIAKNNTSGHKGVSWHKKTGKWAVKVRLKGKHIYLGVYKNLEDAIKVAIEARKKFHGEFGRDE